LSARAVFLAHLLEAAAGVAQGIEERRGDDDAHGEEEVPQPRRAGVEPAHDEHQHKADDDHPQADVALALKLPVLLLALRLLLGLALLLLIFLFHALSSL